MNLLEDYLKYIRDHDWCVAVHNDYFVDGSFWTFWLFTHKVRLVYAKGEGRSDLEAVINCMRQIVSVDAKFTDDSDYIKCLTREVKND